MSDISDDSIFGVDYSSDGELSSTGDIKLVRGLDNAKQSIRNWLLTDKGFYPSVDTEYGSEIREALGEDENTDTLSTLNIYILNALKANPRVESVEAIVPYATVRGELTLNISVLLVNGETETFNINLDEV